MPPPISVALMAKSPSRTTDRATYKIHRIHRREIEVDVICCRIEAELFEGVPLDDAFEFVELFGLQQRHRPFIRVRKCCKRVTVLVVPSFCLT